MDTTTPHFDWHDYVETTFRTEYGGLCRLARRYLSPSGAEEVVQEAFARFATMAGRPKAGAEMSYLRSIVLNEARSVLRRRQVAQRHLHRCVEAATVTPLDVAVDHDERDLVRRHVAQLPTRQREVLELRFRQQLSEREIAAALQISAGTVKTHGSRGLAAMRMSMGVGAA